MEKTRLVINIILSVLLALKFLLVTIGIMFNEYKQEITLEDCFIWGIISMGLIGDEIVKTIKETHEN